MKKTKIIHISFFSGILGFEIAASWCGWHNYATCETDDFCTRVAEYYYPGSYHHRDIRTLTYKILNYELSKRYGKDWRNGATVVISGGFPCQPFSVAGERRGAEDDRYLWPEFKRLIAGIRPDWIIGENVAGITSMVQPGNEVEVENSPSLFEEDNLQTVLEQEYVVETICNDFESIGYSVQPFIIPACAVGAPHRRDRIWFVANCNGNDTLRCGYGETGCKKGKSKGRQEEREWLRGDTERISVKRVIADAKCNRSNQIHKEIESEVSNGNEPHGIGFQQPTADSDELNGHLSGSSTSKISQHKKAGIQPNIVADPGIKYGWNLCGQKSGKHAAYEVDSDTGIRGFWQNFPTQSSICSGNDGLSSRLDSQALLNGKRPRSPYRAFNRWRKESIKAYGNAIVPQVAYQIMNYIDIIIKSTTP